MAIRADDFADGRIGHTQEAVYFTMGQLSGLSKQIYQRIPLIFFTRCDSFLFVNAFKVKAQCLTSVLQTL